MIEGDIVVCPTGQAGTIVTLTQDFAQVLLRNGEMWSGDARLIREPQDGELEAAPLHVERFEARTRRKGRSK